MKKNNFDTFQWFLRLRWGALLGQVALLLLGLFYYDLTLPWREILLILSIIPISDLISRYLHNRGQATKAMIATLLLLDTAILSGVLYCTGGPTNPFSIVYLLHVVLAAVVLDKNWTWSLVAVTSLSFGTLFFFHLPVSEWNHGVQHHHGEAAHLDLHLQGMFFAYLLIASVVASFLTRIIEALNAHQQEVQQLAANQQRLASLTALATNTAHELGTPLSTITVIAHELELSLQGMQHISFEDLARDLNLLKQESTRCRAIIDELCSSSGSITGENLVWLRTTQLVKDATDNLSGKIKTFIDCGPIEIKTSARALTSAIRAIVKNGVDATSNLKDGEVRIDLQFKDEKLLISISDNGGGIPTAVMNKIGSPFISTKKSGEGMGLGIYVAKLVAEQLKGEVTFNTHGRTTTVTFIIPVESRSTLQKAA